MGKDAAVGHTCATKKPILSLDFELGPATGFLELENISEICFVRWRGE